MYKRPPLRVRPPPDGRRFIDKPKEGTFLYKIINPEPTVYAEFVKQSVYNQDSYLKLLKKHYKSLGIEYKDPELPVYIPPPKLNTFKEPELGPPDRVNLKLRFLKSGIIRVKLDTSFCGLYEKYYRKSILPPFKNVITAYKSFGFSDKFIDGIKRKHARRHIIQKRFEKMYESIFNKETVKKVKKKKEEEIKPNEEQIEDIIPIEEPNEDEEIGEDETLDVEPDEDDEEVVDEEYVSDGGE